jgi:hypothetical protein
MTLYRVLILAAVLAMVSAHQARAQFGGMPGMPGMGMPGMPSAPGMPGPAGIPGPSAPGFGGPPSGPPAACQQLMVIKDEVQKNGLALQAATKRKPSPIEGCKLFTAFAASEAKFLHGLEENKATCGVPDDAIKHFRGEFEQVSQMKKQICEAAAQGPRSVGPSLSDALNSAPTLPEPSTSSKSKNGTYDTLTGNPLVR